MKEKDKEKKIRVGKNFFNSVSYEVATGMEAPDNEEMIDNKNQIREK